ncbi:sodium:solute symporter family protein [Saxibacter everestensis]|uniref:Sodium:solute symporter family protein n=1 Tax=Saxibacter everestensis TaxID=2909229 RepID=A0ABY8QZ56_9MICO|nr:sodium:solute symporter family protein [Brevibacteriaceae bacterium ZFBP1038]
MFAAAIIGSFALYLVIGAIVGRTVKNKADYYVAGRSAPTFLIAGTLVASFLSTVSFMGELGFSYDGYPVVMLILTAINISGYVIGVLAFGRYLRRSEALTVPEFFGKRFNSTGLQALAGVMVVVGVGLYLVAVTQGLALVLTQLIDLPYWLVLLIVWAAYTLFTLMSGSRGVLVNDTLMFLIFALAAVLGLGGVIAAAGGPVEAMHKMSAIGSKPDALSWHGLTGETSYMGTPADTLIYAITLGVVWATVVAVSPWQSSRYLMARNEHVALRSGLVATASLAVIYLFLTFGGFSINIFNPNIEPSEIAFIWAAENILPPVVGVIIVTGIAAAGLSSAASFLSLIGFSVANDIMPWISRRSSVTADDATTLRTSRIVMLIAGLAVLGITFIAPPAVMTIGYFAATLFAAAWGPVAVWCIKGTRMTTRGAAAGMISGFLVVGILNGLVEFAGVELPTIANPVILGLLASVAGVLVGNIGQKAPSVGVEFLAKILPTPAAEKSRSDLLITRRVTTATAVVLVLCTGVLVVLYAIPHADFIAGAMP